MGKDLVDKYVSKFWPIIVPWAIVGEDWVAKLKSNGIQLDEVERAVIWLETIYCGVILARNTMDIKLSSAHEVKFEKELLLWISDMSLSTAKEGNNYKKAANVLLRDFQKRKPIYSRHKELGDYSITGNFFGLLKNGIGHKIPDNILTEYAEFKVKQFKELYLKTDKSFR